MAAWTFAQLRHNVVRVSITDGEKEKLQIQIALVEHIVEAIDRLRLAVSATVPRARKPS